MLRKWLAMMSTVVLLATGMIWPSAQTTATSQENILFEDHFDMEQEGVWAVEGGTWAVQDGVYAQSAMGSAGAMSFAGEESWTDYEVSADFVIHNSEQNGPYVMLSGRADGSQNRYIGAYQEGKLVIDHRINGQKQPNLLASVNCARLEKETPYTMTMRFEGDSISVKLEGGNLAEPVVAEATNSTHTSGKIGLATFRAVVDFDNVVVKGLETGEPEPPQPEDGILFEDAFDTGADRWTVENGSWSVQDETYVQSNLSAGAMTFAGDESWTDYEVSVDFIIQKSEGNGPYVMLSGRADGSQNRYIGTYQGGRLQINRRIGGQDQMLADVSCSRLEQGKEYTMTMRFEGDRIHLVVEGIGEADAVDATHSSGKIGLATYKAQVAFDNVVVKKVEGTEDPDPLLSVQAPQNYQVIQRNVQAQSAPVPVEGQVAETVAKVQARVLDYDDSSHVAVDWTELPLESGTYSGELTVPQGGWYCLEVQALDEQGEVLQTITDIHKWGVGINILCIGQSNMVGQGAPPYTVADDLVANFRSNAWSHLQDPYDGAGASLVPAMANMLVENLNLPVGIIPAADSGSGLHQPNEGSPANWYWMYYNEDNPADSSTLYGRAVTRALAAGGVELAVWNQGETDGRMLVPEETYEADMKELLARLRRDLGNEALPIFLCQIGTHDTNISNDAAYSAIRTAQHDLDDGENFFLAATEMEFERKDTAHYTTPGLNEIGRRVANSMLYYYGLSDYYRGPYIDGAVFTDETRTVIDVNVAHRGGDDITPESGITGFSVLDGDTPAVILSAVRQDAHTIRLTLSAPVENSARVRYLYGLNPEHTNVVKDNTDMKLPLEATPRDIVVAEHEHVWGDWTVEKEATAQEEGLEARTCTLCEKRETRVIPALEVMLGDTDGNSIIMASDALLALQAATGKLELNQTQKAAADVNGDGEVGSDDALLILQYATQKIAAFPKTDTVL